MIKTYKQIAKCFGRSLSGRNFKQYINSNLKPAQKMLVETSFVLKIECLMKLLTQKKKSFKYIWRELEVFNSDDELNVFTAILDEFDDSYKDSI